MFQNQIGANLAHGIPGELAFDGPLRGHPVLLASTDAETNVIGSVALFYNAAQDAVATDATVGTGAFAGFLANPKVYAWRGSVLGNAQDAPMTLPNGTIAEAVDEGTLFVMLTTAGNIGDQIVASDTDGTLSAVAQGEAIPAGNRDTGARIVRYPVLEAGLAVIHAGAGFQTVAAAGGV